MYTFTIGICRIGSRIRTLFLNIDFKTAETKPSSRAASPGSGGAMNGAGIADAIQAARSPPAGPQYRAENRDERACRHLPMSPSRRTETYIG